MSIVRVAMWSGPRNISTAMMRAFDNRPDTVVIDEPLYGHYLAETGIDHPMREQVIASMETDWRKVTAALLADPPGGADVFYQKHMTHHLRAHIERDWITELENCFLIRDPAEVIASYAAKRATVSLDDIGVVQQAEIFDDVEKRTDRTPIVLDARDVLENPQGLLTKLCRTLGIEFSGRMLSWPPGRRPTDGVWGAHWYGAVEESTGFAPYRPRVINLSDDLQALADACRPHYERLSTVRLIAD